MTNFEKEIVEEDRIDAAKADEEPVTTTTTTTTTTPIKKQRKQPKKLFDLHRKRGVNLFQNLSLMKPGLKYH
jgi:hypothetical protein